MRLLILTASALLATGLFASADPQDDREAIMKSFGPSLRVLGPVAQGQAEFDAAAVNEALDALNASAQRLDVETLWAPGTEGGRSSPEIWTNLADFTTRMEAFKTDIATAADADPQDIATFQPLFQEISANCGSCHQVYRTQE